MSVALRHLTILIGNVHRVGKTIKEKYKQFRKGLEKTTCCEGARLRALRGAERQSIEQSTPLRIVIRKGSKR